MVTSVLVVAPTDATDVGEAWVAAQWVKLLSTRYAVTLLTYRKRDKPSAVDQLPQARVIEWLEPPLFGRVERLNSMMKPAWIPFYVRARRWIRRAQRNGERFDIGYQPVPVALRYPTPFAGLGIPYVLGPVGGSLESPPGFADTDTAPWYVGLRRVDALRLRRDPLLRRSFADAACVLGIGSYVRESLQDVPLRRFEVMSDAGIERLAAPVDRSARSLPVRLLFVGRVIRTKGVRDVVAALGLRRELPVVFDVVGDGFDRAECERLARELGVEDRVVFHGKVPHDVVASFYEAADVFVFPSFREPGGIVVFEAMANGLPLIVCERGGPGNTVDETCGIRLPAVTPDQYAADLADAIESLVNSPQRRLTMGGAARRRAADIALWDSKIDRMTELFGEIVT